MVKKKHCIRLLIRASEECQRFELNASKAPGWFKFFSDQSEELWNEAIPMTLSDYLNLEG